MLGQPSCCVTLEVVLTSPGAPSGGGPLLSGLTLSEAFWPVPPWAPADCSPVLLAGRSLVQPPQRVLQSRASLAQGARGELCSLTVLAHQDPDSNAPFLPASSDCCPSPGCAPAFHTLPLLSSPTWGLPSLWSPVLVLSPPTRAFADSPSRDGHRGVQGKQACTSFSGA